MLKLTTVLAALAAVAIAIPAATPARADKIVVVKHRDHDRFIPRFHREHRDRTVIIKGHDRDHDRGHDHDHY